MTRKRLSITLLLALFCAGSVYAANWAIKEYNYRARLADQALIAGERDISVKRELSCPDPATTKTIVIFGQSNAANHGTGRGTAPAETYDFFDKRCFEGNDPQFSSTGNGGSPWPAFAHAQRNSGEQRPILLANVAVGNTRIEQWQPRTDHAEHLTQQTRALLEKGYTITAFLYFQGESDRETPENTYREALAKIADMTAQLSPATPLVVSNSSICGHDHNPAPALISARRALAAERSDVFVGPDTDSVGQAYRYDGCHFNREGLDKLGALWSARLNEVLSSR